MRHIRHSLRPGLLFVAFLLAGPTAVLSAPALVTAATSPTTVVRPLPANPKPGDTYVEDLSASPALTMVWIPGGKFQMGNSQSPEELVKIFGGNVRSFANESPAHEVELDGYWMGKFAVTNEQYKLFKPDHRNGRSQDQDLDAVPAMQLSWADANAFCDWLSKRSGRRYTLPTEAQYEYACRAGTTTLFYWGDDLNAAVDYANVPDQKCRREYPVVTESSSKSNLTLFEFDDGFTFAAPVGRFKPNAFGLYDMVGNSYSWCSDWWSADYYQRSPKRNPTGPDSGTAHSARCGAWMIHPIGCRSSARNFAPPGVRRPFLGFRLVVNPVQP